MKITVVLFSLSLTSVITVQPYIMLSTKLTCFSEPAGEASKDCDKTRGFRTCFTRYDHEDKVTGRGCSTKKSSYKECETHSYGEVTEKFCYCTQHLCNPAHLTNSSIVTILLPFLVVLFYTSVPQYHLVTKNRTNITAAPDESASAGVKINSDRGKVPKKILILSKKGKIKANLEHLREVDFKEIGPLKS